MGWAMGGTSTGGAGVDIRMRVLGAQVAREEVSSVGTAVRRVGTETEVAAAKSRHGFGQIGMGMKGLLAGFGITAGVVGIKDFLEAGIRLQQQQKLLRATLQGVGVTGADAYKRVEEAAVSSSEHGGLSRDIEFQSISNFVRLTHNANQAIMANHAAIVLARGAGQNYESVQRYIGQALVGNVKRLSQYVGVIVPVKKAEDALAQSHKTGLAALQEQAKFMGASGPLWLKQQELLHSTTTEQYRAASNAAITADKLATGQMILKRIIQNPAWEKGLKAYNDSTQGRLNNLKVTFDEFAGRVGEKFLPVVNALVAALTGVLSFFQKNSWAAIALASAVTALGSLAFARMLVGGIRMTVRWFFMLNEEMSISEGLSVRLGGAFEALGASMTAMMAALPWVLIIGSIIVLIVLMAKHWDKVKKAASDAWSAITAGGRAAWNWIKGTWPTVEYILVLPFTLAASAISGVFNGIKSAIRSVVNGIRGFFTGLWHDIVQGAQWVFQQIKHIFSNIVNNTPLGIIPNLLHGNFSGALNAATFGTSGFASQLAKGNLKGAAGHIPIVGGFFHSAGGPVRGFASGGGVGADTVPGWLSRGEWVLDRATAQNVGAPYLMQMQAQHGVPHGGNLTITPGPVTLRLDGRTVAQAVVRYTLEKAARGPSSLVGGSLVTGYASDAGSLLGI